jgi:hypothetical protein
MIDYRHDMSFDEKSRLAKSMFNLGRLNETRSAFEFFQAELIRLDSLNRKEVDVNKLFVRQGACQVLEDVIKMIAEARDRIGDFEKPHS